MQGAELRAGVGAQAPGEVAAYVLVGGERLRRAAGVAQRAQPQGLERLVQRMVLAQGGEGGQGVAGPAEGQVGGQPGAAGVQPAALGASRLDARVGEVGQGGAAPQCQRLVEEGGGTGRVGGQRQAALRREPFETVQVHGLGLGAQAVAAVDRGDRGVTEGSAEPADQGLQRAGRVSGRVHAPDVGDQHARGQRPPRPQREGGEQGAQACAAEGDGGAVGPAGLGGAENSVAHRAIVVHRRAAHAALTPLASLGKP